MTGILNLLAGAVSSVIKDTYFNLVTLLLPSDGTNGAQNNTFLDSSSNAFSITRNGNTTQGTFSPFSQTGWSNYFNGSSDFLTMPDNANYVLSGDFTVEAWIFPTSFGGTNGNIILSQWPGTGTGTNQSFQFYVNSTGKVAFVYGIGSTNASVAGTSLSAALNTWNHVAVTRSGSTVRFFVNGSLDSTTGSVSGSLNDSSGSMTVGRINGTDSGYFSGYISNCRLTVGGALYTSAFTPSTTPLGTTVSSGTVYVLTCQNNLFIDNSSLNATITVNGTPSVQAFSPFAPTAAYSAATVGGSGYFDGTGDYLTVADNAALEPAGNNFCIEFSYYPTSVSGTKTLVGKRSNPSTDYGFLILADGANARVYISSANTSYDIVNGTIIGTLITNQWHHIAVYRISNAWYASFNGSITTLNASNASSVNNNAGVWGIGADSNGAAVIQGYMANTRFVIGSSVYTSTSAPFPTAPLTAITNTSLLLNFTNAGITDATAKNDLETVGNAQISTTQSKFGGSSMSFDGTGDWLLMPHTVDQMLGTGAFTIEMWVYRSASGTYGLVGKGTGTTGWLVSLNSSNQVVFTYGSSTITSTGTISATTWTYIAVVREGTGTNQTKIYISGSNDGTGTVSTDFNQTNSMYVGADRTGGSAFNGYIDDLRITKGYARTIATPSSAFPVQ